MQKNKQARSFTIDEVLVKSKQRSLLLHFVSFGMGLDKGLYHPPIVRTDLQIFEHVSMLNKAAQREDVENQKLSVSESIRNKTTR